MYLTIDNAVLSSSKYEDAMNHKVYMIQTHSDFVINQRVYPQAEVEKAQETFYKPYNKPVLLHHDDYSDPIGRVVNQVFFSREQLGEAEKLYQTKIDIPEGATGFLVVECDILDDSVYEKIKSGLYNTVSVGFQAQNIKCNICGADLRGVFGSEHEHRPGETYNGVTMHYVVEGIRYQEISYVNHPADPFAHTFKLGGETIQKDSQLLEYIKQIQNETVTQLYKDAKLDIITNVNYLIDSVVQYQDLPLADENTPWDGSNARKNVAKWQSSDGSGDKDKIDWSKYRKAFLWYSADKPDSMSEYKFPIADVINGKLKAVPKGIMTAAQILQGAMGGTDIPEEDQKKMKTHLEKYYEKMGKKAPWQKEDSNGGIDMDELNALIEKVKQLEDSVKQFEKFMLDYREKEKVQLVNSIIELKKKIKPIKDEDAEQHRLIEKDMDTLETLKTELESLIVKNEVDEPVDEPVQEEPKVEEKEEVVETPVDEVSNEEKPESVDQKQVQDEKEIKIVKSQDNEVQKKEPKSIIDTLKDLGLYNEKTE